MKIDIYCYLTAEILAKLLQKCFLSGPRLNISFFVVTSYFAEKILNHQLLRSCVGDKAETLQNCF